MGWPPLPLPKKETKEPSSEVPAQATPYASTGTYQNCATPTLISLGTDAPAAGTMTMEPKPAGLPNPKFRTSTPYHANEWHTILKSNSLLNKYRHIPISLQHGFNAAIKYIARTFTPPNNESVSVYHNIFQQSVQH